MDAFYLVSTTAFLAAFVFGIRREISDADNRGILASCFLLGALYTGVLVSVSLAYDFGADGYPSRESPYLVSGRLILGALVPFLIMYLSGLEWLFGWLRLRGARVPVLIAMVVLMGIVQIFYLAPVFASQYNWFHLP